MVEKNISENMVANNSPFTLLFQAPPPLPETVKKSSPSSPQAETKALPLAPNEEVTEPQKANVSTRLEAKKQRRRETRDYPKRRPAVSQAEFLARRESVDRVMVVRSHHGRTQIGVLEDGVLVEHYVTQGQNVSLMGNIYLARVQNVLPSMEAAFLDIGRGRNAVLYAGEVNWDETQLESTGGKQQRRIEAALKVGDQVIAQVTKDPAGHKGARLTSQLSLAGRYLIYIPGGGITGVSRKLPKNERTRLKKILRDKIAPDTPVIVRTAAEGATAEQIVRDAEQLTQQWVEIQRAAEVRPAPSLLYAEPDLLVKIIRDVFNEDFQRLIISGDDARETIESYLGLVAPDLLGRVEIYAKEQDVFEKYRITEQIEKALDRKVWLPSGGSLVIDRTEAMTVIDVNTGRFVGNGGDLEETVTKNNLEAAEEIVRQLRLRDIGGIIVIDFIDMILEANRELVLRKLSEWFAYDRSRHQIAEVTSLGLVQLTRKKKSQGLIEAFSEPCEVCGGRGIIVHHKPLGDDVAESSVPTRSKRGRTTLSALGKPTGAREITDNVRQALAKIASSTVTQENIVEESSDLSELVQEVEHAQELQAPDPAQELQAPDPQDSSPVVFEPVTVLGIPLVPVERPVAKVEPEGDTVLDLVLDSLPAPPAPGRGRGRRAARRAAAP